MEHTEEVLEADVEALTDEVATVLVGVEHEDQVLFGLDEPAGPAGEHRPQGVGQRSRDG